jgi:phospholipase C
VREENISAWRRAICGDLTSVFRPYDLQEPALKYLNRDKFVAGIEKARYREIPSNYAALTTAQVEQINHSPQDSESMPRQEQGIRPSCALPYELYADAHVSADGEQCELHLSAANSEHGANSAGAPFNVYLRNLKETIGMKAATYAVKAGDTLTVQYPLALFAEKRYVIEVYGPNGFYRLFTAIGSSSPIEARMAYERRNGRLTGSALVHVWNNSSESAEIQVTDNAYKTKAVTRSIEPREDISVSLSLEASQGWYDMTVIAKGADAAARFAGRIETGKPGISDPAMAGND